MVTRINSMIKTTFQRAFVRQPSPLLSHGLTCKSQREKEEIDFELSCHQHEEYKKALQACGIKEIIELPQLDDYPDGVFVEDTAILTSKFVMLARPGAPSRRGEVESVRGFLEDVYTPANVFEVQSPGTLDGGDVMCVGDHFFVGLSKRTNQLGANQLMECLKSHGYTASVIQLGHHRHVLHLKSMVTFVGYDTFIASSHVKKEEFILPQKQQIDHHRFQIIHDPLEHAGVNCLNINGTVLCATGFPTVQRRLASMNIPLKLLDNSEIRKIDGGLTCCSLLF